MIEVSDRVVGMLRRVLSVAKESLGRGHVKL